MTDELQEVPRTVVLYNPKPGEGWRYAIYTEPRAVIDGRLSELATDAPAAEAQRQMVQKLDEFFGAEHRVKWAEDKPGWWTGTVERGST